MRHKEPWRRRKKGRGHTARMRDSRNLSLATAGVLCVYIYIYVCIGIHVAERFGDLWKMKICPFCNPLCRFIYKYGFALIYIYFFLYIYIFFL